MTMLMQYCPLLYAGVYSGECILKDIQTHLRDALDWSLEWMSSILGADVTRLPFPFLGANQRSHCKSICSSID